jgi:CspA family cold shock protein
MTARLPGFGGAVHIKGRPEDIPMATKGTVKFFNQDKGFGFITPEGGAKDVFVHISALQAAGLQTLKDGQQVTFDTEPDRMGKGPKAVNISAA